MRSSFSALEFAAKKKVTRRERFLSEIDAITPWSALVRQLESFYPSGKGRGRPPIGLERMLRMYVVQQCLGLSDEGIEDAIYDSQTVRGFVGIDLAREAAPDATTLLKFRRLLETQGLTEAIFKTIHAHLAAKGMVLREGTVVDATIIAAPSSTKNSRGQRDPEMHQTKKGKQWHFGMKAHIGVDAASGLVHTVIGTAAHINDVTQAHALLHGEETDVYADAGYQGADKRPEARGDAHWRVALRPSVRKGLTRRNGFDRFIKAAERIKASVRAKDPFHIIKNRLGLTKVHYRGLMKNTAQLFTLFSLANLLIAKRRLLALRAQGAS
ncbi:MAG TPA: IS5 family transposase [Burkholderiaceae bacterium]|nr:IS5 family transposase [Burkholderiaceae bacterium]